MSRLDPGVTFAAQLVHDELDSLRVFRTRLEFAVLEHRKCQTRLTEAERALAAARESFEAQEARLLEAIRRLSSGIRRRADVFDGLADEEDGR